MSRLFLHNKKKKKRAGNVRKSGNRSMEWMDFDDDMEEYEDEWDGETDEYEDEYEDDEYESEDDYDEILCYGISFFKKRCMVKKK